MIGFELLKSDGAARVGKLITPHGVVETPAFMPVGTQGTVKSLTPEDLRQVGAQIVLANTYHLYLRPGHRVIQELGGLHRFMAWEGPILTDSGGYQVMSLSAFRKVTEEGVRFRSHLDGSEHLLTPELAIEIQQALGVDIVLTLDECLAQPADHESTERSLRLTLRWAERSKRLHEKDSTDTQTLFGIVQGGRFEELRRRAVSESVAIGFDGYALGGFAVGEPKPLMLDLVELTAALLPRDRPRYLMGVGKPPDLVQAVARGIDLFDCVLPTRNARTGQLFTWHGPVSIKQARYLSDERPLEEGCSCYTCHRFTRAYLRHLYMAEELLAYRLNTLHNLTFYMTLMARIRQAIELGALSGLLRQVEEAYQRGSENDETA
ncbi:MAG TPA: tRNA guanosine(34) transglycosylase Tgt [Methylomirabilota bacterium]|nr:tRNA guanosine(34) transglycosylase Tgt [Methylomirabilota bacterium]